MSSSAAGKCHLTKDVRTEQESLGDEVWFRNPSKNCTGSCWSFESDSSGFDLGRDPADRLSQDKSFIACNFVELGEDRSLCTADEAWSLNRTGCMDKCNSTQGCQSFTYSETEQQCYLSRHSNETQTVSEAQGYESWTTECTTTTVCEFCPLNCTHQHILDLRFIVWSNLGGRGPNRSLEVPSVDRRGRPRKDRRGNQRMTKIDAPKTIMYYNVFGLNDTDLREGKTITYLEVANTSPYEGDGDMNGVSYEPEAIMKARLRENPQSKPAEQISGAYGIINVKSGTSVDLKFTFMEKADGRLQPVSHPEKVVAITYLDIDQAIGARTLKEEDIGEESVSTCTGEHSFGFASNNKREIRQLNHSWEMNRANGEVCHTLKSLAKGDPSDNPWDPQQEVGRDAEGNPVWGLKDKQKEKSFTAAYWNVTNFAATFAVKKGGSNRNLMFVGHATGFCSKLMADKVKDDSNKKAEKER